MPSKKEISKEIRANLASANTVLGAQKLSAPAVKAILKTIIVSIQDLDFRLQDIEREVGLPDSYISMDDANRRVK